MIMRPPADYTALRDLKVPNTFVFAARAGDDVNDMQRVNLGLTVGVDIAPLRTDAMPRPADDADRRAWQDFAVVRGVPYTEAVNMDRAELLARIETQEDAPEPVDLTVMPTEGDLKARWLDYALLETQRRHEGRYTEEQISAVLAGYTKAELIAIFGPEADAQAAADFDAALAGDQPEG